MDTQIRDAIESRLNLGKTRDEIRQEFLASGYSIEEFDIFFDDVTGSALSAKQEKLFSHNNLILITTALTVIIVVSAIGFLTLFSNTDRTAESKLAELNNNDQTNLTDEQIDSSAKEYEDTTEVSEVAPANNEPTINKAAVTDKQVMNLSGFVSNPGFETTFYSSSPYIKTNLRIDNDFVECTERLLLVGETEIITPKLDMTTRAVRPNAMGNIDQSYLDGTWFIPEQYFDRTGKYKPRIELDCGSKVYADEYIAEFTFTKTDEKSNSSSDPSITIIPLTAEERTTYSYGDQIKIRFTVLGLDTLPSGKYIVMSALSDGSNEYFGVGFPFEITDDGKLPTFSATTFTLKPGVEQDKQCTEEDPYFQSTLNDPGFIQQAAEEGVDMDNLSEEEFRSVCEYVNYGSIPVGVYRQGVAIVDENMNVISIEQGEQVTITE